MKVTLEGIGKEQDKYLRKLKEKRNPIWLQEQRLFDVLRSMFNNVDFQKKHKIDNKVMKPDITINDKIVVEFQGNKHFTISTTVYNDKLKKSIFENHNFIFVEIPYFVQLTSKVMNYYFGVDSDFSDSFPHGFVYPDLNYPGDFCLSGLRKYFSFLRKLPIEVPEQCYLSLLNRSKIENKPFYVFLPEEV